MNELFCTFCGGKLELKTAYDGRNEIAEDYHPDYSKWWSYELAMQCVSCSKVFPIARMRTFNGISRIRKEAAT